MRYFFKTVVLEILFHTGQGMHLHPNIVKSFVKIMRIIDAAQDERDLRVVNGRRMEKLSGDREGQYSIRLNDQYHLMFTINHLDGNYIFIIEMIDHH